jgi:hypothetical protein
MKFLLSFGCIALSVAATGCGTGTSTAQSTDPNRPNAERRLTVTVPNSQSVTQDRTEEVSISVNRDRFSGPVAIDFRSLPSGVEVATQDMMIPADKSSLKVTLKASAAAQPVKDHSVTVGAKATQERDLPEATASFKLDVKSK